MRQLPACLALVAAGTAAGTARAAAAPPLATLAVDVDGDGAADAIELGGDGVVRISGTPRGEVKLAPSIAQGQLAATLYRGRHYVVAQITANAAREAAILRADNGVWHEVLRSALGGVGLDHDYAVEIDVTPDGIYRYQTRGDIRRCDGRPGYLFAEKFDGMRFRRSSALPSNVSDAAPVLTARLDGAAPAPLLYQARAASLQIGAGDAGGLAIPRELDDGRPDTLWREELAASSGEGQFFTFEPRATEIRAAQLRIVPGNPSSSATIKSFNRPRKIAVVAAGEAWRVELPDAASEPLGAAFVVDLPRPVAGCVTVILETTYGPPQGTTAIAELEIFADGERTATGEALLAHAVAQGNASATAAAAALGKRGPAAAAAIDSELAATTDPGARRRLIGALAGVADPAAAPALVHAAIAGWVRDRDLLDVIAALGALGQAQALHDLAASSALPPAARTAAVEQIPASGAGFEWLVDLLGRFTANGASAAGSASDLTRELRRASIERLSAAPVAALVTAAAAQTTSAAMGDLWRAMTRSARGAPARRAPVLSALHDALPLATDYERRYRLVDGIAALGDRAALGSLEQLLRALPASAETAALRQVALRAIAEAPRSDAVGFVLDSMGDRDPGVRLAALTALAGELDPARSWGSESRDAIDRAAGAAIARDPWPEVRRRAATALAMRCQRPEPARALGEAVDRDTDLGVRGDALSALVQCRASGVAARLAKLWDDGKAPIELRTRAVHEAAALGDPALATTLVARFTRWRGEAISSADALVLAQSAAAAIARLAAPGASRALLDALDDAAFPEIVQAAALGLGALGPACPPAARTRLLTLAREGEQVAAAAKRAAAQCGRRQE